MVLTWAVPVFEKNKKIALEKLLKITDTSGL